MQFREGSFPGPRPACPQDPTQQVHRHGAYERYADCDGQRCVRIERFRCPRCGRTFSVLPQDRLPYRAVTTPRLEAPVRCPRFGHRSTAHRRKRARLPAASLATVRRPRRSFMRFAGPNDCTHPPQRKRVLEGATAPRQPRRHSAAVGHQVQHLPFGRLPLLPTARILSGKPATLNRARPLEADPTQRWRFLSGGSAARLAGV
jgi:transposase-like protein